MSNEDQPLPHGSEHARTQAASQVCENQAAAELQFATDRMPTARRLVSYCALDGEAYAGTSVPVTYEANGEQYVVVPAGGHTMYASTMGNSVVAYKLSH